MDDQIKQVAQALREAKQIAILTGAGASAESGVPTFRDALTGLWAKYDPSELATPTAFKQNPKLVWDWYEFRRGLVRNAIPNAGHVAIAQLQALHPQVTLITQNVDDLHERAGSPAVIHLHGNIAENKCFFDCQGHPTLVDMTQVTDYPNNAPPACPHCGRWLRPNVVWFHENLPAHELNLAQQASTTCDVMLIVGTSGLVQPAASLPTLAMRHKNALLIEVNPHASAYSNRVDYWFSAPSGVVLPQIVEAMTHA